MLVWVRAALSMIYLDSVLTGGRISMVVSKRLLLIRL